jgi:hypothetical protein
MKKCVKKLPKDYYEQTSFYENDVMLWQNGKVYVMDNHRDAAWCWLQQCKTEELYNFMHIDQHYDLLDSYYSETLTAIKNNPKMAYDEFASLMRDERGEYRLFSWDNYIRIMHELRPNWFNTNVFVTQGYGGDANSDGWGHEKMRIQETSPLYLLFAIRQNMIEKWSSELRSENENLKWIVNFDLDVFFCHEYDHVKIFSDRFIRKVARLLQEAMANIQVLTIAISPDCLEGKGMKKRWDSGFRVLRIMAEEIDALQEFPFPECID